MISKNAWSERWFFWRPFVLAPVTVIVSGILTNELTVVLDRIVKGTDGVDSRWPTGIESLLVVLLFAFLIGLIWQWHLYSRELLKFRTRRYQRLRAEHTPRSHVILFLSNLNVMAGHPRRNAADDGSPLDFTFNRQCNSSEKVPEDEQLDKDLKTFKDSPPHAQWPWEQMLRALQPHSKTLQAVYCICSQQSLEQADKFRAMAQKYKQFKTIRFYVVLKDGRNVLLESAASKPSTGGASFTKPELGLDFEDYDQLAKVLRELVNHLMTKDKVKEDNIVIDFTGGQKVTSVAAVATTFDSKIIAQYVQTGGEKIAYSYDMVVDRVRLDQPVK